MSKIKKKYPKELKFQAALAMIKGEQTVAQLSQKFSVHQSALHRWKQELLKNGPAIFEGKPQTQEGCPGIEGLQRKIGELTMEIDFLKKASSLLI